MKYLNEKNPVVTISVKNVGAIKLQLFPELAPNTVANFIKYVNLKYYDGLIFHRVIQNFMIQGGWGKDLFPPIRGEFSQNGFDNPILHEPGVISMARTQDKNSQTAQFFIMHKASPHLDGAYAAFGQVVKGFNHVDLIAAIETDQRDRPLKDVVIESISVDLKSYQPVDPIYLEKKEE